MGSEMCIRDRQWSEVSLDDRQVSACSDVSGHATQAQVRGHPEAGHSHSKPSVSASREGGGRAGHPTQRLGVCERPVIYSIKSLFSLFNEGRNSI